MNLPIKKIVIFLILAGIVLSLLAVWYWTSNVYSKDNVRIEILGPSEANAFDEVEYTVKYKNTGNIRMEDPRMVFEFPEYSVSAGTSQEDQSKFQRRQEIKGDELGEIYPGEEKTFKFKGRLFGKEGDIKTAKVWLTYKPKNLSAKYESSTTFSTRLKQVPLSFDFDLSSKLEAGREFNLTINYFSNVDYPLSDLAVLVTYPSGFEYVSSTPKSLDHTEWDLPVLNKAEGGRISVNGRMTSDTGANGIFSAKIGTWQNNEFVPLKEISKGITIGEPKLDVFQRVNGNDSYTARPGELLHYEIFFRNMGRDPFKDMFMVVKLDGKAFDLGSIKTNNGDVSGSSIVWDWRKVSQLAMLNGGEEGKVEFWINLKNDGSESSNPVLKDSVEIAQTTNNFEIKMGTKLEISQKVLYQDDAFGNEGPNPPKSGESTTYTVNWQVKNYYSDVKNVTARATLPSNVKLTGKIFPESESSKLTFDSQSREVVWKISEGAFAPGTGANLFFQVELKPSASQKNTVPVIIGPVKVKGEDQWTGGDVESSDSSVDATLPDDNNISNHSGIVQ